MKQNPDSQGPIWEVFVQAKSGQPFRHAGGLHAFDKEMAIENARDLYCRRGEAVGLWVVPAAEIVAAALHDRGRGLVLGRRTFGRGSVQNLVDLDRWSVAPVRRYGGVKLTVGMVYRVNGLPIEGDGLEPDIALGPPAAPLPRDTAVPAVAPVPALPTRESQWADALATSLPRLRDAHATRLAATPAFRDWARARQAAEDGRRSGRLSLDPAIRRSQRLPGTSGDDVERQLALAVMADMAEAAAKSRSGAPNAR